MKSKNPIADAWHYMVGNYRYKLYYSKDNKGELRGAWNKHPLMRQHIWEQIKFRINNMNPKCYSEGSCIKCGCETTALQMCNKPCEGMEYPPIVNKKEWKLFLNSNVGIRYITRDNKEYVWVYLPNHERYTILTKTNTGYVKAII